MNQLNSIILEGNVVEKPVFDNAGSVILAQFPISVKRVSKSLDGNISEEVYKFDIKTYGKMAEICNDKCIPNRGIRVVGRLAEHEGKVSVIAEHIEYKPVFNK